ncbi:LysR family transcriptional regulator [Polycladidibacter stylochi]|uniref:LysR family transcriptional regulator n=1 Tax=Polycladidibacter stylochi TaxID=1807766 RepID=UPI00083762EE|nr:LysR family transcriptional regulator [Pseudovibrio stylochi]
MKASQITWFYWFCLAAQKGSLVGAAQSAGVSAATISRSLQSLEEELGVKLAHRNAKQFDLTTAGQQYYRYLAQDMFCVVDKLQEVHETNRNCEGDIYVSCPETIANNMLHYWSLEFMEQNPLVNIHITFSSPLLDEVGNQNLDLAILFREPQPSRLIQKKVLSFEMGLFAAPSYLKKHGVPFTISELEEHQLISGCQKNEIAYTAGHEKQRFTYKSHYSINGMTAIVDATTRGVGICCLPVKLISKQLSQGVLVRILEDVVLESTNMYFLYDDRSKISERVQRFISFLLEKLKRSGLILESVGTPNVE